MKPYRVIIADDHVLVRQGLRRLLEEKGDLSIVGEVGDGLELLALIKKVKTDMVVLDISMPNLGGIEAARKIKETYPDIKVLILTMHNGETYLSQAIAARVDGYVMKENCDTDLFEAIDRVRKGKMYISPCMADSVLEKWLRVQRGGDRTAGSEPLSPRENEIIKLLVDGKSNREIAKVMGLSVRTVEYHRANLMKKLQLKSVADLVKFALQKGYA